ncbi:hypothetical protein MMC20_004750 [Loxospora ochrophaea]|nr:hypothetical protein [Loxospora ochrophaea]
MERLNSSTPHLIRWLSHTGGRLHVVVIESEDVPADRGQMVSLQKSMRSVGLDVILHAANKHDTFPQRYFSLINILYRNRHPDTHWIGLIDDDTFFPSMSALISKLSGFDPQQQYYIGTLSEDWWAVSNYGYMAFGGGGIFLSIPLANILDANTGTCKDHIGTSAGDIAVMDCVYAHTTTKLTHIPELHQVDIFGDLSGLYESGRLPLSLHHWKGGSYFGPDGNGYPLEKMHLVSEICGDCFLQRWQFGDDTILSNGFSIAAYPRGHLTGESPVDLEKIEETWHGNTLFRHSLGPTRPRLALEDEKLQHTLVDSMLTASGVRQLYKRNGVDGDIDTVLELFWTLDAS